VDANNRKAACAASAGMMNDAARHKGEVMSIELKPDTNGFRYVLLWLNYHIENKQDADQSYLIEWADFVRDARDEIERLHSSPDEYIGAYRDECAATMKEQFARIAALELALAQRDRQINELKELLCDAGQHIEYDPGGELSARIDAARATSSVAVE
jgi:hypothetical protein